MEKFKIFWQLKKNKGKASHDEREGECEIFFFPIKEKDKKIDN